MAGPAPTAGIQNGTVDSSVLGEQRRYSVWLPSGHEASQDRYPVLFLLDGPRHFSYATGMVEYLSRYAEVSAPAIVVDIERQRRGRDMTPICVLGQCHDRRSDSAAGNRQIRRVMC